MVIIRRIKVFLKDFKDYLELPNDIRERVDKQLMRLCENPRHPSLWLKKLRGTDKFEIRISKGYRLTLQIEKEMLELLRIGTHDLLREEGRRLR